MTDPAMRAPSRRSVQQLVWHHPEWWVVAIAAAAWALLIAVPAHGVAPHHGGHGGAGAPPGGAWIAVMVVAMMAPLMLPTARHVALTSLWSRRNRMQVAFLAGYLVPWMLALFALTAVVEAASDVSSRVVVLGLAVVVAAAWQFARHKRVALSRCTRTVPLALSGWRAHRDCLRFGTVAGGSCVVTCWGFMTVAAAAGHRVEVMALLFGAQLYERVRRCYAPHAGVSAVAAAGVWVLVS